MSATEGWVSITDALAHLWDKVYKEEPPTIDSTKRLPRAVYIKAYWPPTGPHKEEVTAIHLENLHMPLDDPTNNLQSDEVINEAISNFRSTVLDPQNVKDDTCGHCG